MNCVSVGDFGGESLLLLPPLLLLPLLPLLAAAATSADLTPRNGQLAN
jgi:hypothetical protein